MVKPFTAWCADQKEPEQAAQDQSPEEPSEPDYVTRVKDKFRLKMHGEEKTED